MKTYLDNIVEIIGDVALFYIAAQVDSFIFKIITLVVLGYKLFRLCYDCLGAWEEG